VHGEGRVGQPLEDGGFQDQRVERPVALRGLPQFRRDGGWSGCVLLLFVFELQVAADEQDGRAVSERGDRFPVRVLEFEDVDGHDGFVLVAHGVLRGLVPEVGCAEVGEAVEFHGFALVRDGQELPVAGEHL